MEKTPFALRTLAASIAIVLVPTLAVAGASADAAANSVTTTANNSQLPSLPNYTNKEYADGGNAEALQYQVFNDPDFYKPLAYLGHYMGFGWAGGTNSGFIGEDMEVKRIDSKTYSINARYNSNDPHADGYWAHKRLKMKVKDVKLVTNPADLILGEPEVYDREALATVNAMVYNCGNTEDTAPVDIGYSETTSWSKTDNFSFGQSLSVTNKYEVGVPLIGGASSEVKVEFNASQGWNETNGDSTSIDQKAQYRAQVPEMSKRYITLTLFKQKADIPYNSFAYLSYNIDYEGFLRWGGNARSDHPTDRPYITHTFGHANGLNGPQQIADEYKFSYIGGYSGWDWHWMRDEFGQSNLNWAIGNVAKRKYGAPMSGKFTTVDGSQYNITAGASIRLTPEEIATLANCSQPVNSRMARLRTASSQLGLKVESIDKHSDDNTVSNITMSLAAPLTM
ncbi:putative Aerolysin/haemolysin/leukocidin toxin [Vibrio nigripulchritudo MADA3029]|uniref:aerolysin family beta-barrel pore-forming toxin n=1 Tax=Vibrio nigripulchritudo TaxID=28173 RepID=UPI0003B23179|nr:aerolysin family beta-barrel pore-forming toxin [Vibrio nigripulchritudo]CCN49623.1 putative Aerolysin/haemolysin/leukocidin toxin [Vibrio nigripulchritudo MADA3020]CCN53642.1 putative Aerolysin/haemolysin/leukocidin toxin [Vibrio nigripulchritudo MADA3021]CCN58475.1 putative Aerolysin/haemolysin/leukocidin toxin [Vibrio nigripulchritudo MADA3029]